MISVFFDTNIMIDLILQRTRVSKIQHILEQIDVLQKFQISISAKSFADIYYILRKDVLKLHIDNALESIIILDSSSSSCKFATQNTDKHDDVEDLMQVACCNENKIDIFITADISFVKRYNRLFNRQIQIELIQ